MKGQQKTMEYVKIFRKRQFVNTLVFFTLLRVIMKVVTQKTKKFNHK